MRSKTAERILSETPQEIKDEVRILTDRQVQLLQIGFKRNDDQQCFGLYKYRESWYVDFWRITDLNDKEWNTFIGCLKYDLVEAKNKLEQDELYLLGKKSAQKEFEKRIRDQYNHYNSKLKELTKPKLDRRDRTETIIKLEAKVELLRELKNKLK